MLTYFAHTAAMDVDAETREKLLDDYCFSYSTGLLDLQNPPLVRCLDKLRERQISLRVISVSRLLALFKLVNLDVRLQNF
jgi:hypothetical protein